MGHLNVVTFVLCQATEDKIIEQQQRDRTQILRRSCKSQKLNKAKLDKSELRYIIVSDKYKTMYCYIPKVACTQWNTVFLSLDNRTNVTNVHDPKYFKFLNQYSDKDVEFRLKTYFKFLFVREPLERLVSAYVNKFVNHQWEWRHILQYSKEIVDSYRQEYRDADDNVTFTKFIFYLTGAGFDNNRHWNLYDKLCHPCAIHYDFIGHFENMPKEASYVLRKTGMDRVATFPPFYSHNTSAKMAEKYSEVPRWKIIELANAYQKDFEMFSYPFPGPLTQLLRDFY